MNAFRLRKLATVFTVFAITIFLLTEHASAQVIGSGGTVYSKICKTAVGTVSPEQKAQIGCESSSIPGSGTTGGGRPGQPLPSQNTQQIKDTMCRDYKVCPTENGNASPPNRGWTVEQLTALWNIVQRIYESPKYKTLAIGNYVLEMQRVGCYPFGCDGTWGYYAGQTRPDWARHPNSRLIMITNAFSDNSQSQASMEWLLAHEIGHSASGGQIDGTLTSQLGLNEPYRMVQNCGQVVSSYGYTNWNENNSEILSFYMTASEPAIGGYLGPADNLARDFPCIYNAVRTHYFGGVEF